MSLQEDNAVAEEIDPEEELKDRLIGWVTVVQQKFDDTTQFTTRISRTCAKSRDATEAAITAVALDTLSAAGAVANAAYSSRSET